MIAFHTPQDEVSYYEDLIELAESQAEHYKQLKPLTNKNVQAYLQYSTLAASARKILKMKEAL